MINTEPGHYHDELLVQRYRKGEKEALTVLIRKFHPKLIRIIRYQIHDNGPAEDIAQECWYHIIKKLPELELKISFTAWAGCIARRKAIDWIRKQQLIREHTQEMLLDEASKIDDLTEAEYRERQLAMIRIGIQQLPPTQQIVLTMFYVDNLDIQEISDVLHVSKGTIKSRLFYGRENLKKIINKFTED
jgi:RNA polymerase sigma factor (sigma-70 family)